MPASGDLVYLCVQDHREMWAVIVDVTCILGLSYYQYQWMVMVSVKACPKIVLQRAPGHNGSDPKKDWCLRFF